MSSRHSHRSRLLKYNIPDIRNSIRTWAHSPSMNKPSNSDNQSWLDWFLGNGSWKSYLRAREINYISAIWWARGSREKKRCRVLLKLQLSLFLIFDIALVSVTFLQQDMTLTLFVVQNKWNISIHIDINTLCVN